MSTTVSPLASESNLATPLNQSTPDLTPKKAMRAAAILAAIQPSQREQTKSALKNAEKKRKRVQKKHGEVLTYAESLARLKVEEEQRLSKNKDKENRQKRGKNK